jgi:multimeric flavodoxin WrbA
MIWAELLDKFREADYFVLATPVYVDGMTAQAKTFVDRIIPLVDAHLELVEGHFRHVTRYKKYPQVVLVSVCGGYEMDNFEGLVDHVARLCRHLHTRFVGAVLRPGSSILSMEEVLPEPVKQIKEAARRAGKELVIDGSLTSQTLEEIARHYMTKEVFLQKVNQFWDRCLEAGKVLSVSKPRL